MNYVDVLHNHALNRPTHPAVADSGGAVTYGQLDGLVDATARRLRAAGIRQGDIVALALPSTIEHILAVCGLMRLGAAFLSVDPQWTPPEFHGRMRQFDIRWLLSETGAPVPPGYHSIQLDQSWRNMMPSPRADGEFPGGRELPATLILSSGTTGNQKALLITHGQLYERFMVSVLNVGYAPHDRYGTTIPLSFRLSLNNCLNMLRVGGTVMLLPQVQSPDVVPELMRQNGITWTTITPHHLRLLLPLGDGRTPLLPTIRRLAVSTSMLQPEERDEARRRLTPHLYEQYGANECSLIAMAAPEDQVRRPASVGRVAVGINVEIVDDEDRRMPPGAVGQIRIRTPSLSDGYYRNPEATARSFRDGWFYPGDLVARDEDGYLHLHGRADDLINLDGIKIMPDEIEEVLLAHPAVVEAAVVGYVNEHQNEVPVAFIVVRNPIPPEELLQHCARRLAATKMPRGLFQVPMLPKSEMGKVLRRELRQRTPELMTK